MGESNIPLVDLKVQYEGLKEEFIQGIQRVCSNTAFILGDDVAQFENEFSEFSGTKHCVGVASGTDALELALRALGIGTGDEVIVPTNSFIASALGVIRSGAAPVLVDMDPSYLINIQELESAITSHTAAIMPVHLYGQLAPMDEIRNIADRYKLAVIEDAAQAQGARDAGRSAGGFGDVGATSFYPGKNMGAFGDAGAVLTDSDDLARRVRALRNWGSEEKYFHPEIGFNSRLDTIQAAVLRVKLRHLDTWNQRRREVALRYDGLLKGNERIVTPGATPAESHVWHLYVIRVPNRDEVLRRLHAAGIGAGIHYPIPIHLQTAMQHLGHKKGDFPNAEEAAEEILSLPLYPEITVADQDRVVGVLIDAVGSNE